MSTTLPVLSLFESRVLGVLAEKQRTVPDTYPLTLNALISGCNQKSSRNPVIKITEHDVLETLDSLRSLSLIVETNGRVTHFAHNLENVLHIPTQSTALLAILMLRGPQTAGQLRINCERLHKFADISSVESFLDELSERKEGSLVVELPRQLGSRETRWMHTLSGVAAIEESDITGVDHAISEARVDEISLLKSSVAKLEEELSELQATVTMLLADRKLN